MMDDWHSPRKGLAPGGFGRACVRMDGVVVRWRN